MADYNSLRARRLKAFNDATSMKENPEMIPHVSFFVTWKVHDYGCKLSEALNDYDLMKDVVKSFQKRYGFDGFVEYGNRNQYRVSELMGSSVYQVDDEAGSVYYLDSCVCEDGELAEYAKDPNKFVWEKVVPRKYPFWSEGVTAEFMNKLNEEFLGFITFNNAIKKEMSDELGVPELWEFRGGMTTLGVEYIFQTLRGIKGMSIDMRRNKQILKDAIEAYENLSLKPAHDAMKAAPKGHSKYAVFDSDLTMLAHTVMNPKQFEEFYWPSLKRQLDIVEDHDWTIRIFTENFGNICWDYLNNYKPGTVCLHLEKDDVFDLRNACPGVVIMGGINTELLYYGTEQECVDRAKYLCDTIGAKGGFMLTQDKLVSYRNDCKRENLLALTKYMNERNGMEV